MILLKQSLESAISFGIKCKGSFQYFIFYLSVFLGYPCDGIFNDQLVDLIRDTLEENGIFVNENKEIKNQDEI